MKKFATLLMITMGLLFTTLFFSTSNGPTPLENSEPHTSYDNSNWHNGTEINTNEVNITYEETYAYEGEGSERDILNQNMQISYLDKTDAKMGFHMRHYFNEGGLDVENEEVLNWSKADELVPTFFSESYNEDGERIIIRYSLQELSIFNGSFDDFGYCNGSLDPGIWEILPKGKGLDGSGGGLGRISFKWGNMTIGEFSLSTREYTYKGKQYNESRAEFDIEVDAIMGDYHKKKCVPATFSYQIIHNLTHNWFEYDLDIDWTIEKNFTTDKSIEHGNDYFLVPREKYELWGFNGDQDVGTFDTDDFNKTAVFKDLDGNTFLTQTYPLNYNVVNASESETFDTKRLFFYNGRGNGSQTIASKMLVYYGGFKYNISTGMNFDPTFIIPLSIYEEDSGIDDVTIFGYNMVIFLAILVSFIGILSLLKKRTN